MKTQSTVSLLAAATLIFSQSAEAVVTPGDLDPTFGTGGRLAVPFSPATNYATAAAIQADGKILGVGYVDRGNSPDSLLLTRVTTAGVPDPTFGTDGAVAVKFGGRATRGAAAVVQPDGKIVVVGYASSVVTGNDFVVFRFNTDGSLDTSFNGTGSATVAVYASGADEAYGVALQADGKIVLAGRAGASSGGNDFAVARFTAAGVLDTSFNTTGFATLSFSTQADEAYGVAVQADGKIVLGGENECVLGG